MHTYSTSGTYKVTLTVYSLDGFSDQVSYVVKVDSNGGGGYDPDYERPDQNKPTQVYIKSYTVNAISFVDANGRYWDDSASDGPDIYMRIYDGSDELYNFDHDRLEDVTKYDIPFNRSLGVTFYDLSKTYTFKLCDYDMFFVDYMYVFDFKPQNFVNDCPKKIYAKSDGFSIELELEWK